MVAFPVGGAAQRSQPFRTSFLKIYDGSRRCSPAVREAKARACATTEELAALAKAEGVELSDD